MSSVLGPGPKESREKGDPPQDEEGAALRGAQRGAEPLPSQEPLRCQECGDDFDPRFSRNGLYCFSCSVHVACACADDPA